MKERPILFSAPMVRANMDGRKKQTRRTSRLDVLNDVNPNDWAFEGCDLQADGTEIFATFRNLTTGNLTSIKCPYGVPGDELWVRETWSRDFANHYPFDPVWYFADDDRAIEIGRRDGVQGIFSPESNAFVPFKWRPSIHMPRDLCRWHVAITAIRIERLLDITEEDAVAEGIDPLFSPRQARARADCDLKPMPWANYLWHGHIGKTITQAQSDAWPHQFSSYTDAVGSYSSLWEAINGTGSWALNPWVWVVSYKTAGTQEVPPC